MSSRRNFLKGLAGLAAYSLAPIAVVIPKLEPTVTALRHYSLSDIIVATLKARQHIIMNNITKHNALFKRLNRDT